MSCSKNGFTLIELLAVIAIVGVLSAIMAPTWLRLLAEQQVSNGNGLVNLEIKKAQTYAQRYNSLWQLSVRQNGDFVEIATHRVVDSPSMASWEAIDKSVQLDTGETTVLRSSSDDIYYVRFNEKGNVRASTLGRITLSSKRFTDIKRCVFISTLLGATRVSENHESIDSGESGGDSDVAVGLLLRE